MKLILLVFLILSTVLLFTSAIHKKSKIVNKEAGMNEVDPEDPGTRAHIDTALTHWPQLLGKTAAEAEAAIKADRPDLNIHTLSKNAMTTMDFKTNRIRIYVDENNIVVRPPVVGADAFLRDGTFFSKSRRRIWFDVSHSEPFYDSKVISPFSDKETIKTMTKQHAEPLTLTSENVECVLNEMRPYLIEDGGNVRLDGIQGTTLRLELEGACVGCPSSAQTLKMGLERKLKERIPSITEVVRTTPFAVEITKENIEGVLNKIRPIIAVSNCNVEIVDMASGEDSISEVLLRMTGGTAGMPAVKFEIVQRLGRYFNERLKVKWE